MLHSLFILKQEKNVKVKSDGTNRGRSKTGGIYMWRDGGGAERGCGSGREGGEVGREGGLDGSLSTTATSSCLVYATQPLQVRQQLTFLVFKISLNAFGARTKRKTHQGSRGGVRARFRRSPTNPPPSPRLFSATRSLYVTIKMDELQSNIRYNCAY